MGSFSLSSLLFSLTLLSPLSVSIPTPVTSSLIPVSDPNWYFTEHNWFQDHALGSSSYYAQTSAPGAYFKVGFTGTSVKLDLDWLGAISTTDAYMTIRYSVDDLLFEDALIPLTQEYGSTKQWFDANGIRIRQEREEHRQKYGAEHKIPYSLTSPLPLSHSLSTSSYLTSSTSGVLTLASNLHATEQHTLILWVVNSLTWPDRWYAPAAFLRITGLELDAGATTVPPVLRPHRTIVYGDSITEGYKLQGTGHGDIVDNDGTTTWALALADALDSEISVVGWCGQGFGISGSGNVPPLFTPGNDSLSAWNKHDQTHSRLDSAGIFYSVVPDYIVSGHGTNDGIHGISDNAVIQIASQWLTQVRNAAPQSIIFLAIPFGLYKSSAITTAFNTYQSATPDSDTLLLTFDSSTSIGIITPGYFSTESFDGLHPNGRRHPMLGARLAVQFALARAGKDGGETNDNKLQRREL